MNRDTLYTLKCRRAIRKFKSTQITHEKLNTVLEAGIYAPSGCGTQSPVIVAVQDPGAISQINAMSAAVIGQDIQPYYGAPTIILIFASEQAMSPDIGILDAAAACTNMLNAAHAVGLGSCWIHRCKEIFESAEGKALLTQWGLPDTLQGVASIALGYSDCDNPSPAPRKLDRIVRI